MNGSSTRGLSVIPGSFHGPLVFSDVPLSFMMGVDPKTGVVVDAHHLLLGTSVKGKVLAIPCGRGSCSGSGALLELILTGNAPSALIFQEPEMILTLGVMVAEAMFDRRIPVIFLQGNEDFEKLRGASEVDISDKQLLIMPNQVALPLEPRSTRGISLSTSDEKVLSGQGGEASRIAMEIIVAFAALQEAKCLVDVSQVHIDACAYNGKSSLHVPEHLLSLGGQFVVPSTCNSLNVDRLRWKELGTDSEAVIIGDKIGEAYLKLGAKLSFTCAPYLLDSKPKAGEQVGWSESNAVVFVNSVLGAHTQKYPDYLDVFIALTGRAPYAGCHTPEGRKPKIIIEVPQLSGHDQSLFPLLGYHIGDIVGGKIPFIVGMEKTNPTMSDLKAFGAGFATTSSAPMFHMRAITPEAASFDGQTESLGRVVVDVNGLRKAWKQLNTASDPSLDMVSLGNPHFSVEEFAQLADLCRNKTKSPSVAVIITTSRDIYQKALKLGHLDVLEAFGAQFITDTCCISCREARKKCCERKPECTRCSLKGLTCTYEVIEPKWSKTTKRTSPSSKKARNIFAGRELKPEEGFIHTFAVTKPTPSRPPEETIDLTVSPQLDVNSCNMDLDESMELFDTFGNSSESEVCSILTNSIFDDSVSARSGSVDPMSLSLELPFPIFSDLTTDLQSRKLLHHFCSTLSRLIVFVEQPHNSFQDLILPLAYDNSPVFYAICAFACGHLEHSGVYESRHSSEYRALAAKGAFELVQWKCQHEEVLATVMLLAYYEALTSSNAPDMFVGHLKAAFLVISSIPESERSTSVCFLEKAFHYYDVISSLSLGMSPVSAVSVSDYTYPLAVMTSSKPNDITHADPFMGLVGDLWPVLYRLSIAMSLKGDLEAAVAANQGTKAAVLRVEYESITKSTEKALQSWQPSVDPSNILMSLEEDGNAQHQHLEAMVHNAQAYRHSALVYLHRTVYGYPMSHPEVQKNAHLSLESCMAVIASGGPANALLWPLYVAACEAVTDHDQ
ncbi:L-arabinose-responsive transcription regulator ARA1 [Colletotrichum siamense]|uniref:L-arabinose-responsive transcription regulator ARA1 n=1 Tax=Colletotrichum siamense TaxID=690259 RepID=UPI001873347E|nr:L-arabinose-responsive transcription regulator ARA1 [Colletotrichum siamense]KAF5501049.1 L-arabinose-responsive transcription regulator ARA1 [Colletotrichum siamense]